MLDHYIAATIILLVAYFIRGVTGFGSGLIAVPLLAHLLPLSFVVPLILVTDFIASLALSRHARDQVRWDEIRLLIPAGLAGVFLGVFLLVEAPQDALLTALAVFVMFFGVRYLFNIHNEDPIGRWWSVPAGLSGGTVGALFGTGGPPYVIYLSHRLHDKSQLRATFSGLFLVEGGLRIIVFLAMGLFVQGSMLTMLLLSLFPMTLGLVLGNRVHDRITRRQQLGLIGALLIASGASLILKVLN